MVARHVVMHCDANDIANSYRLMRTLAIAEEANSRGWSVHIGGSFDPSYRVALDQLARDGVRLTSVTSDRVERWISEVISSEAPTVLHIDAHSPISLSPHRSFLLSNMQGDALGHRPADLTIDPDLGAENSPATTPYSGARMLGLSAVPVSRRTSASRMHMKSTGQRARVLVVVDSADMERILGPIIRGLCGRPLDLTVAVPSQHLRAAVDVATDDRRSHVDFIPMHPDIYSSAWEQDLVIRDAGPSIWEALHLGIPVAVLCACRSQRPRYAKIIHDDLALGLGFADAYPDPTQALAGVWSLIDNSSALADLGMQRGIPVDGLGAWRIVSAWDQLAELASPRQNRYDQTLRARPATIEDLDLLYEWRNDPSTRVASRIKAELRWDAHQAWLVNALNDAARQLYIIEQRGEPAGSVRWDNHGGETWEASIIVDPRRRGRGIAASVLRTGECALQTTKIAHLTAAIHVRNSASRRLFARAGYLPHLPPDHGGYATYDKWRN